MALISCNECSGKVSDKAATCPHCGAPVTPDTMAASVSAVKKRSIVKWIIAVPLTLIVFSCAFKVGSNMDAADEFVKKEGIALVTGTQSQASQEHSDLSAKAACRDFVRARLKKPFTAEFPDYEKFDATRNHDDQKVLLVSGSVRSEEGQRSFNCTVKERATGMWQLLGVEFFG